MNILKSLKKLTKAEGLQIHEGKRRSLVKAVTWRVIATLTTMVLVFIATGELTVTLGVGVLDVVTKLIFYFGHERMWNLITWGKYKKN